MSAITCDRCGGGHGPWDSYAEGRILLCCECRENVPDAVRYAPSATEQKRSSLAGETP